MANRQKGKYHLITILFRVKRQMCISNNIEKATKKVEKIKTTLAFYINQHIDTIPIDFYTLI